MIELKENATHSTAKKYWAKAGISPEDIFSIDFLIGEIEFFTSPNCKIRRDAGKLAEGVSENARLLRQIEKKYGLEDYCRYAAEDKEVLTLQQGMAEISGFSKKAPAGITGKPGVGKTTLLKVFNKDYGIRTIDEFWEQGGEDHERQKQELHQYLILKMPVIVAAAQLEKNEMIRTVAFMQSDDKTRKHNISTRKGKDIWMSLADRVRLEYFEAYSSVDNFLYGMQKIDSDIIIDASAIRY